MLAYKKFGQQLIEWSFENPRVLPWVNSKDPYVIWISEIMLQQTRANQVIPFFQKFVKRFPNLRALATAKEEEVLLYWEGLGYYSRARNLYASAQYIVKELDGNFPQDYEGIRALKGIGDYTATAIASFAYGYPGVAIDGNAIRVISRYFGVNKQYKDALDKKKYIEIANKCLGSENSSKFNQALMDLGATVCHVRSPNCPICPQIEGCFAFQHEKIADFPPKKTNIKKKLRNFNYFVLIDDFRNSLIKQRDKKDIWKGLYEFPMVEKQMDFELNIGQIQEELDKLFERYELLEWYVIKHKHILTHQVLNVRFYIIRIGTDLRLKNNLEYKVESVENFLNFAFPRIIRVFIDQKLITKRYVKQGVINR